MMSAADLNLITFASLRYSGGRFIFTVPVLPLIYSAVRKMPQQHVGDGDCVFKCAGVNLMLYQKRGYQRRRYVVPSHFGRSMMNMNRISAGHTKHKDRPVSRCTSHPSLRFAPSIEVMATKKSAIMKYTEIAIQNIDMLTSTSTEVVEVLSG